jgi:hypothetical protein
MAMGKDMTYNFKLDPDNPEHVAAAKILDSLSRYAKRKLLVAAILAYNGSEKYPDGQSLQPASMDEIKQIVAEMLDQRFQKDNQGSEPGYLPAESEHDEADSKQTKDEIQIDILNGLSGFMH